MNKPEAIAFLQKLSERKHVRITHFSPEGYECASNVCKKWVDHRYFDERHGTNVLHCWGILDDSIPCSCGVTEHNKLVEEAMKAIQ